MKPKLTATFYRW